MGFLNSMNISASGLTAQRLRLDVTAENITNLNTTRTENGGPYRRKMVVFESIEQSDFRRALSSARSKVDNAPIGGVRVSEIMEDEAPFRPVYNPEHPDADEEGYVLMPNVDLIKETVDGMAASRAYEANVTAINAIKAMAVKALEIGR